jgi:uncharacterized protein YoxC
MITTLGGRDYTVYGNLASGYFIRCGGKKQNVRARDIASGVPSKRRSGGPGCRKDDSNWAFENTSLPSHGQALHPTASASTPASAASAASVVEIHSELGGGAVPIVRAVADLRSPKSMFTVLAGREYVVYGTPALGYFMRCGGKKNRVRANSIAIGTPTKKRSGGPGCRKEDSNWNWVHGSLPAHGKPLQDDEETEDEDEPTPVRRVVAPPSVASPVRKLLTEANKIAKALNESTFKIVTDMPIFKEFTRAHKKLVDCDENSSEYNNTVCRYRAALKVLAADVNKITASLTDHANVVINDATIASLTAATVKTAVKGVIDAIDKNNTSYRFSDFFTHEILVNIMKIKEALTNATNHYSPDYKKHNNPIILQQRLRRIHLAINDSDWSDNGLDALTLDLNHLGDDIEEIAYTLTDEATDASTLAAELKPINELLSGYNHR